MLDLAAIVLVRFLGFVEFVLRGVFLESDLRQSVLNGTERSAGRVYVEERHGWKFIGSAVSRTVLCYWTGK